jgi:hypothetical protein
VRREAVGEVPDAFPDLVNAGVRLMTDPLAPIACEAWWSVKIMTMFWRHDCA